MEAPKNPSRLAWLRRAVRGLRRTEGKAPSATEERMTRRELFQGLPARARKLGRWWASLSPYQRTAIETLFVTIGCRIAHKQVIHALDRERAEENRKRGARAWKNLPPKMQMEQSLLMGVKGGLVKPMLEELFFRQFPSALLDKYMPKVKGEISFEYGIPISLIFAAAHIPNFPPEYRSKYFPISQFMFGCYLWYAQRKRGYGSAVLAHSEWNFITSLLEIAEWNSTKTSR